MIERLLFLYQLIPSGLSILSPTYFNSASGDIPIHYLSITSISEALLSILLHFVPSIARSWSLNQTANFSICLSLFKAINIFHQVASEGAVLDLTQMHSLILGSRAFLSFLLSSLLPSLIIA
jgi:hypothetical protein